MTRAMAKISRDTPIRTMNEVPSRFARRRTTGGIFFAMRFRSVERLRSVELGGAGGIAPARFLIRYSFISISRKLKPKPATLNAFAVSESAGTETRLLAANTATWS